MPRGAALGGAVVVDVSTLVVGGHLRHLWPQLRASFARLEMPSPAHRDVLNAVEDFRAPADGTLYFDTSAQTVRGSDADLDAKERLLNQGEWVEAEVAEVVVVDWPRIVELSEALDETFLPWLSALDMAKARGMALWCDDVGLRTLAASDGVPAFGTTALIAALETERRLDEGEAQSALRQLRQEYAVDLPLDAEWLRLSAASDEWRPGPSAFYFSRRPAWLDFEQAYELWSEFVQLAATAEPVRVAGWVHAAAYGVCGAVAADEVSNVLAAIAAKGIAAAKFDDEAIAACSARVREVALAAGLANPVPTLMATLLRYLTDIMGRETAARLVSSLELADPDRAVVRDLVSGLRSDPGPLDL